MINHILIYIISHFYQRIMLDGHKNNKNINSVMIKITDSKFNLFGYFSIFELTYSTFFLKI